jgi:hypothetical protein
MKPVTADNVSELTNSCGSGFAHLPAKIQLVDLIRRFQ